MPFSAVDGLEIPSDRELDLVPADGDGSSVADLEPGKGLSVDPAMPNDAFPPSFFSAREVVPPESGSLLVTLDPKMKLEDELGLIPDGTCDACAEPNKNPVLDAELDDAVSSSLLLLLACERLSLPSDTTPDDEGLDLVPVKGDGACEADAEPNINPTVDRPLSADAPSPPLLLSACDRLNMPDDVAPREEGLVLPAPDPESAAGDGLDLIPVNKDTCGVGILPNVNPTFEVLDDVTSSTLFLSA